MSALSLPKCAGASEQHYLRLGHIPYSPESDMLQRARRARSRPFAARLCDAGEGRSMAQQISSDEPVDGNDETSGKPDRRILEDYLSELKAIRASGAGVAETSYYPALSRYSTRLAGPLNQRSAALLTLRTKVPACPTADYSLPNNFNANLTASPRPGNCHRAELLKPREQSPISKPSRSVPR